MAVFELKAEIAAAQAEAWSEHLTEGEIASLMVIEDRPAAKAWLAGYFESVSAAEEAWAAVGSLAGMMRPAAMVVSELPDADWKESYKQHFKAQHFGSLHWVPVWERDSYRVPEGEAVLWLDPGMAFGTGNHETTRLCGERLGEFAQKWGTNGSVIDAGCGSGILALSAAVSGFSDVRGFDLDPVAIEISRENAHLNRLDGRVAFEEADLVTGLAGRRADLLIANIQADVLIRFAPILVGAVRPGGCLVLSGILAIELESVKSVFSAAAPGSALESRVMGEWSDVAMTLNPSPASRLLPRL